MSQVHVGTSGWNYNHWAGVFYPQGHPKSRWLEYYTSIFATVEVNATFYRSMPSSTLAAWCARSPDDFVWSLKAHRFITHIRRLQEVAEPVDSLVASLAPIRDKLGVVLFQLPPSLVFEAAVFSAFCRCLPRDLRLCIEARHKSWTGEEALGLMRAHNIAWCISDTAGRYPFLVAITADFAYVRLHGSQSLYASDYSESELVDWAHRIRSWDRETYVYFDNDYQGYAPHNALRLQHLLSPD